MLQLCILSLYTSRFSKQLFKILPSTLQSQPNPSQSFMSLNNENKLAMLLTLLSWWVLASPWFQLSLLVSFWRNARTIWSTCSWSAEWTNAATGSAIQLLTSSKRTCPSSVSSDLLSSSTRIMMECGYFTYYSLLRLWCLLTRLLSSSHRKQVLRLSFSA